ncbi:MAG: heme biosynthesis protein HemY [Halioglobus sp.]|nr:heme biosynthesis protein HemY [Halioglobus sp.]
MRKLFAIGLIALLLGVGIVALIETEPGYVLLSYGNWTLETSLWVGLLLLLLMALLLLLLLRLVYRLVGGQRSLVYWWGSRRLRSAQELSARGIISYAEGNWETARKQLVRGASANDAPLANYLLAARCSAQLQDMNKVDEYLRAAQEVAPDAEVAIEVALAEVRLQAGDYQQAVDALDGAARSIGKYPHVLSLLSRAYQGLGDWSKLAELLPQLQKQKLANTADLQALERQVHLHLLAKPGLSEEALHTTWQSLPSRLQRDTAIIELYVEKLVSLEDYVSAEKVIWRTLKQDWSSALVQQYGLLQLPDANRQLTRAESWLSAHSDDAELLLCLGRLSARDKLWGKAREYFENSYRINPGAEVCAELGRLLTALGEPNVAAAYYREGLLQGAVPLPELPMPLSDKQLASL